MNSSFNDSVLPAMNVEITSERDLLLTTLQIVLQVFLYFVGLYINIKLIYVCKKDKGITWKISVTHSIVMTLNYGHIIPFNAVTHFVPFLSQYTGSWICYAVSVSQFYSYHAIISHSLVVSIMKYTFIVHGIKTFKYGESKIKEYFFWANIMNPILLAVAALLTSDLKARSSLMSCFGDTEEISQQNNATFSGPGTFFFNTSMQKEDYNIVLFYAIQFLQMFRSIINGVTVTNIPEGFLYYKIFRKMKR